MTDPRGFLKITEREVAPKRPVALRLRDWREVVDPANPEMVMRQATRCMDCGVPFCHQGCPLGNLIPEWNDLAGQGRWKEAAERLHATNNFPEFTGRICPAPCESACVLGISQPAVTIKQTEQAIADTAFSVDAVEPHPPTRLSGKTVAVVGSGPAGLACAQQLTRAGHTVAVYERECEPGGLLRFGIPDFKLEKELVARRIQQLKLEGTRFRCGIEIGKDMSWAELRRRYDAVVVATGATVPRDLPLPGRELRGIHFAMDYLTAQNHANMRGERVSSDFDAAGKHVVVLGGGDTGADCVGTALRQGAASVTSLAIGRKPAASREGDAEHPEQPWPLHPLLFEVSSSHEEGGERRYLASTTEFVGNDDGRVTGLKVAETGFFADGRGPVPGTERLLQADMVLLALGFTAAEEVSEARFHLQQTTRGAFARANDYSTALNGVFVAGDAGRGQSLIVWAIAEGRACAAAVDKWLTGETVLPAPVTPADQPLR